MKRETFVWKSDSLRERAAGKTTIPAKVLINIPDVETRKRPLLQTTVSFTLT